MGAPFTTPNNKGRQADSVYKVRQNLPEVLRRTENWETLIFCLKITLFLFTPGFYTPTFGCF